MCARAHDPRAVAQGFCLLEQDRVVRAEAVGKADADRFGHERQRNRLIKRQRSPAGHEARPRSPRRGLKTTKGRSPRRDLRSSDTRPRCPDCRPQARPSQRTNVGTRNPRMTLAWKALALGQNQPF